MFLMVAVVRCVCVKDSSVEVLGNGSRYFVREMAVWFGAYLLCLRVWRLRGCGVVDGGGMAVSWNSRWGVLMSELCFLGCGGVGCVRGW